MACMANTSLNGSAPPRRTNQGTLRSKALAQNQIPLFLTYTFGLWVPLKHSLAPILSGSIACKAIRGIRSFETFHGLRSCPAFRTAAVKGLSHALDRVGASSASP